MQVRMKKGGPVEGRGKCQRTMFDVFKDTPWQVCRRSRVAVSNVAEAASIHALSA